MKIQLDVDFSEEEKREMLKRATSEQLADALTYLPLNKQEEIRNNLMPTAFEAFAKMYNDKKIDLSIIVSIMDNDEINKELGEYVDVFELWDELDTIINGSKSFNYQ